MEEPAAGCGLVFVWRRWRRHDGEFVPQALGAPLFRQPVQQALISTQHGLLLTTAGEVFFLKNVTQGLEGDDDSTLTPREDATRNLREKYPRSSDSSSADNTDVPPSGTQLGSLDVNLHTAAVAPENAKTQVEEDSIASANPASEPSEDCQQPGPTDGADAWDIAPMRALLGKVVLSVAVGRTHCGAVCSGGVPFMWGCNTHGQCGRSAPDAIGSPAPVPTLEAGPGREAPPLADVAQLACGDAFTLALSLRGEAWEWGGVPGRSGGGDCGSGMAAVVPPRVVEALRGVCVVQVACGAQHCLALARRARSTVAAAAAVAGPEPDTCAHCRQLLVTMTDAADHVVISDEHHCLASEAVTASNQCGGETERGVVRAHHDSSLPEESKVPVQMAEDILESQSRPVEVETCSLGRGEGSRVRRSVEAEEGEGGGRKCLSLVDVRAVREECSRRLSLPGLVQGLAHVSRFARKTDGSREGARPGPATLPSSPEAEWASSLPCLQTELWSWGRGLEGQLGLGDFNPRAEAECVKTLSGQETVKVVAGGYHSMALTSTGQVWLWGCNSRGHRGHASSSPPLPRLLMGPPAQEVWDISAGDFGSLLLCDGPGHCPRLFHVGGEPTLASVAVIPVPEQVGHVFSVSLSGNVFVSLSDGGPSFSSATAATAPEGFVAALHELSATERACYRELQAAKTHVLKPLLNSDAAAALRGSPVEAAFQTAVDTFRSTCWLLGQHGASLGTFLGGRRDVGDLFVVSQLATHTQTFQKYFSSFTNLLVLDGIEVISRIAGECLKVGLQALKQSAQGQANERADEASLADGLLRLLSWPGDRAQEYARLTKQMCGSFPGGSTEWQSLHKVSSCWAALAASLARERAAADRTRLFWAACSSKLTESLRRPERRLVRESRSCPLALHHTARFSIHWFILFNDAFIHAQFSSHQVFPLSTVWAEPFSDEDATRHTLRIITPEEQLLLVTPDAKGKTEWLWALNDTIERALSSADGWMHKGGTALVLGTPPHHGWGGPPPVARTAVHTFYRDARLKHATYEGAWVCGKPHGRGVLKWLDGRVYVGVFRNGLEDGFGELCVPNQLLGKDDVYCGQWKAARMHGQGAIRYANGDVYEGGFSNGARHGHGVLRSGSHTSTSSSLYIGQWANDCKCGYGVFDDITRGEKYMGMWMNDCRHGNGVVVSQFGLYYECVFSSNRMAGQGVLLSEDDTRYEGEFTADLALNGKGVLTLPNGDAIEGSFGGVWGGGELRVAGTFRKAFLLEPGRASPTPPQWGGLAVPVKEKWCGVFAECCALLGCDREGHGEARRAWDSVAVALSSGRRHGPHSAHGRSEVMSHAQTLTMESLEIIPLYNVEHLDNRGYEQVKTYLTKACDTVVHPLGRLVATLVTVYRATYVGVGANKRLLPQAVEEVRSYAQRIFGIVRFLFPGLPEEGQCLRPPQGESANPEPALATCVEEAGETVTSLGLVLPLLLPRLYPPLFTLYALHNERPDDDFWERVRRLNKQSDTGLLSFLGVQQKFWPLSESMLTDNQHRLSELRDICFAEAVDSLQQISTTFTPEDKLSVIQRTFEQINEALRGVVQPDYVWSMDDLFPVFLFVVLRARIRNLGSEIQLIEDLMDPFLQHGEQGLMFTTLKACYHQILREKPT
ncbi:alsin isoform X1 [Lampetra fluviatilis]